MKLRTKIFLTFSILATIPLVLFTLFSYGRYSQVTYQRMDDISSHLMENAEYTANATLNSIQQTAGAFNFYYNDGSSIISDLKHFKNANSKPEVFDYYTLSQSFKKTCQNLLYSDESINGIYIFTPSGYIFESSTRENGTVNSEYDFQNKDWYQNTLSLDGAMYVSSNAVHDLFTGDRKSIFFSQCLKDIYSHEVVGVLVIDCKTDMLDLSSVNTMPDITLLTIDNTDTDDVLYTNYDELPSSFSKKRTNIMRTTLKISPLRLTVVVDYDSMFRECKLRSNGMPVPLLRNGYSIFNGTKYR